MRFDFIEFLLVSLIACCLMGYLLLDAHADKPCKHNPTWKHTVTTKDPYMRLSALCWDSGGHIEAYRDWPEIQVYCYGGKGYPGDD